MSTDTDRPVAARRGATHPRDRAQAWVRVAAAALALVAFLGAASPPLEPEALAVVQRMAERIANADRIRVDGEVAWDVVQADGRTLEFGAMRDLLLRRPDRLRVDIALREGPRRRVLYDGEQVVVQDLDQNVYATAKQSGPVDDVIEYVSDRLGIPVALSEFLSPNLPALLTTGLSAADYVGAETIDGVRCDHVSLRNASRGLQLWIAQDDSLPRRITITYEQEPGQPQFRARFSVWDLAPKANDAEFAFEPPKGAERIAFAPRPAAPAQEESK